MIELDPIVEASDAIIVYQYEIWMRRTKVPRENGKTDVS